ncbi:beta-defensin 129 [Phyllostomus discolor]|uniref:Beta-defensin 129 n=1 Tax=Phyllostomus discolor TaxID=89673 RepID=A0A6J2MHU2_9CHIR|nr:beta-defensin 129 [Phyllostomus discolor]
MKLLFPIFASLMLQYQVNTELFGWKRCLTGFGRCKDHCSVDEREMQKCKKKKCCVGLKTVRLINTYLQNELLQALKEDIPRPINITKLSSPAIQTKYRSLSLSPQVKSPVAKRHLNAISISSASPGNSASTSTNPVASGEITRPATPTKGNTRESRGSATDSPQPSPPP